MNAQADDNNRTAVAGPVERQVRPAVGDYVLATKYSDGDPGDAWALGFYAGEMLDTYSGQIKVAPRYLVSDSSGKTIRPNGYRRVARVRKDVGAWLLNVAAKQLEQSPPGTVNLWTMLTPAAFDTTDEQAQSDDGTLLRAADMLTAYAELIRRDGATHVEEHHYLPDVEFIAAELRARAVFAWPNVELTGAQRP